MAVAEDVDTRGSELDKIIAWRLSALLIAGWQLHRAEQIAKRLDVDLHAANALIERGCAQRTALQILL